MFFAWSLFFFGYIETYDRSRASAGHMIFDNDAGASTPNMLCSFVKVPRDINQIICSLLLLNRPLYKLQRIFQRYNFYMYLCS